MQDYIRWDSQVPLVPKGLKEKKLNTCYVREKRQRIELS